jgi:single-strand DNA-binding protein
MINVTVSGHVGQDSELKNVAGSNVLVFSLASTKKVNKNGSPEQVTHWINCSIWGDRADKLKQYILKGSSLVCVGEGEVRVFNKADGTTGANLNVRVSDFQFMGSKEQTQTNAPQPQANKPAATNLTMEEDLPF